ncbi:YitT family protein [Barrientosiimonas marina]|uniref:YitT family protein n=1 Tax=Lentibacillus kimchii TaxID=1542911 RepID=A0ABW2USQ5_9BACI
MTKQVLRDYALVIIGATLVGIAYNLFLLPSRLAAGGISGVSTIIYEVYNISPATSQFLINIPIFILGWITLGKDFSWKALLGTFWVPLIIYLTADFPYTVTNPVLGTLYGAIILGTGLGTVFKGGGSTGGTASIAQVVKKFTGISSGYSQLIVDGMVVVSSIIVFNLELTLFALICIYLTGKTIDVVQLRTSATKLMMIITEDEASIQRIIHEQIDRGLTKVRSIGGYTNQNQTMILCVADQQEAVKIKGLLQDKEPTAFVVFLNASEVLGRGFSLNKYYGQKF